MNTQSCLVVMYHYVRDSAATPFPEIRSLAPELFARQLDWLQENYTIIDVPALEAAVDGGAPLPARAALLTFDDGFVDHCEQALPLMRARGIRGAFFLTESACGDAPRLLGVHKTHFLLAHLGAHEFGRAVLARCGSAVRAGGQPVFGTDRWEDADEKAIKRLLNYELPFEQSERVLDELFATHIGDAGEFARRLYLNPEMVRQMAADGMTFGYHTRSHRMLSRLTAAEQRRELSGGVEWIRRLTGQDRVPFCYPWGGRQTYTQETLDLLAESGYSIAFNTVRRRVRVERDGRYELPRLDTRDLPPYTAGEPDALAPAAAGEDA